MKKWMNDNFTTIAIYALLVILAATVFFFAVINIGPLFDFILYILFAARSIVFAVFIALTLFPLCNLAERFIKSRIFTKNDRPLTARLLSTSVAFLGAAALVAAVVVAMLPLGKENYSELQDTLTGYLQEILRMIRENPLLYDFIQAQTGISGSTPESIITDLLTHYSEIFNGIASGLGNALVSIVSNVSDILIAIVLAFYFLVSRDRIQGLLRKITVAVFPARFRTWMSILVIRLYTNFAEYLSARLLCSFALGALCYLPTWALQIKFYPLFSLIVFLLNMVPVIGPVVAAVAGTLILLVIQPALSWIFLLVIIGLNILEQYLIEHYLLSKRLRPSAAVAVIIELIAFRYFGFLGMVLAIPTFATLRDELRHLIDHRLRKKDLPTDIDAYIAPGVPAAARAEAEEETDYEVTVLPADAGGNGLFEEEDPSGNE